MNNDLCSSKVFTIATLLGDCVCVCVYFVFVTMIAAIHVHRFLWIRINSINSAKYEMWTRGKRIWVVYKLVLNWQHTELAGSIDRSFSHYLCTFVQYVYIHAFTLSIFRVRFLFFWKKAQFVTRMMRRK